MSWILEQINREILSSFLGYSSILAWLCAQIPQLYENYRLGSAEGLALPFLISWAFGDFSNLVGCILTRQLPFQTYLASYFVMVDIGLISQFTYYAWKNPSPKLPPFIHSNSHHRHIHSRSASRVVPRRSSKRNRTRSGDQHNNNNNNNNNASRRTTGGFEDPMERSWMSESSSVAHSPASTRPSTRPQTVYNNHSRQQSLSRIVTNNISSSPSSNSQPPTPTPINFNNHSESRGRTLTRPIPRPSFFGTGLETISGSPASTLPAGILTGNYSVTSVVTASTKVRPVGGGGGTRNVGSTSTSRTRPPSARRSTSMVFLSVGLLFSFSKWNNFGQLGGSSSEPVVVWSTERKNSIEEVVVPSIWEGLRHPQLLETSQVEPIRIRTNQKRQNSDQLSNLQKSKHDNDEPIEVEPPYPYPKRDFERFIGRSSAWLCTSLYLTSRLPQIWQNFRRRSVQGLSMILFIMAFVGNSLYVASILTNPAMSSPGYLLETTPYLLGSGGTLCFDLTIVMQSIWYSEKIERRKMKAKYTAIVGEGEEGANSRRNGHHDLDGITTTDDEEEEDTDTLNGRRYETSSRSVSGSRMGRSSSNRRSLGYKRSESTELAKSKKRWSSSSSPNQSTPSSFYYSSSNDEGDLDQEFNLGEPQLHSHHSTLISNSNRSHSRTTTLSGHEIEDILEEGESSVTLRV